MTKWVIGGFEAPATQDKRKVPCQSKQRIKDDMTDAQKRGTAMWNLMIDVLKENGLMDDK